MSLTRNLPPTRLLAALALAGLIATACDRGPKPLPPAVPQLLQTTVSVEPDSLPASVRKQKERVRAWKETQSFYGKRGYQLAWSDAGGPLPRAGELLETIDKLAAEGLDVRRYEHAKLSELVKQAEADESLDDPQAQRRLVDLDVQLTYTYLTMAAHIATGRLQPETLRIDWYTKPRNVDLDVRLERTLAKEAGAIEESLRSLAPTNEEYDRLRDALAQYREIEERGGWPQIPEGPILKAGARGERVRALYIRLAVTRDLPPLKDGKPAAHTDLFDARVASGVIRFQKRHGLDATGVVDADTLEALNVPYDVRIRQLQANLERWRWMPSDLGERYILVNIPEFRMELIENGKPALAMRVVVGKTQSRTPVFSDRMTYLELNPAWNLPNSIVSDEIVPKLANDPGYLARNNMEVVKGWNDSEAIDPGAVDWSQLGRNGSEYRLRQRPGPDNPLGKVKFMFPNEWDIYLHDTPADHLFAKEDRDFSHGCIRLERPLALAEYLLKDDPKWTPEAIQAKLASGEQESVSLKRPLPVHLVYWTARAEKDGTVQFRKDLYGHDEALVEGLTKEPSVLLDLNAIRGEVRAAR